MAHKGTDEASNGALIGTKEEIIDRLYELKEGGINYILLVANYLKIKLHRMVCFFTSHPKFRGLWHTQKRHYIR